MTQRVPDTQVPSDVEHMRQFKLSCGDKVMLDAGYPADLRDARALLAELEAGQGVELPLDRDLLGRFVREAWVRWAQAQPDPKPSWLVPYDELAEPDKEADRQIGETIAKWTMIHHDAALALEAENAKLREATLSHAADLVAQLRDRRYGMGDVFSPAEVAAISYFATDLIALLRAAALKGKKTCPPQ